jgi:diaminopimelate epimerase
MRTYERGVEGETLACGTGAVAVAGCLALLGRASLPLELRTASGRVLCVSGMPSPTGVRQAKLAGEGGLVFRAVLGDVAG